MDGGAGPFVTPDPSMGRLRRARRLASALLCRGPLDVVPVAFLLHGRARGARAAGLVGSRKGGSPPIGWAVGARAQNESHEQEVERP